MELLHRGKVRDVYSDRPGEVILVATDRVSVYDVVLPTPIPEKGKLLTSLSLWWFDQLADVMPNHVISATDVPAEFEGRAVRCQQVEVGRSVAKLIDAPSAGDGEIKSLTQDEAR
ncbi:phosphoribosylaminoimidazolesuccinocarboxamide synthase [Kribbella sp. GL6]|uniref:phosphoribosylaminoimidazolesuccinocarboxamide synthase n=1 Tax=Kribbella sp. GL6 TaxID=3419765 RepID=UPI003D0624A5